MFPWTDMFPFNKKKKSHMNPNEIEGYVGDILSKSIPKNIDVLNGNDFFKQSFEFLQSLDRKQEKKKKPQLQWNVFETLDHVFIQVPVQEAKQLLQMKITHSPTQTMIEGFPTKDSKHVIHLPSIVKNQGATAIYKNNLLEIKLPKEQNIKYTKINVRKSK
jgi:HSP20 family molecular chaperone IbpA